MHLQNKFSDLMHRFAEENHFSGTVLAAKEGDILYKEAFGLANREHEVPNRIGSKFRIASLTKAFTALAVLQLAEQGSLSLQDRLRTYLPEYPELDERITLHHLLTHTSGIRDIEDVPQFTGHLEKLSYDKPGFIGLYKDLPPFFAPGEGWKYGNCGYTMLAYIIEAVTGLSYERYLRQHIFEPLGMNDTGCDSHTKFVKHRSDGYSTVEGDIVPAMYYDLGTVMASGDLYSTACDLLKWDQGLYTEKLVSSESIRQMFTPHAHVSDSHHYGYGWNIYPKYAEHKGWLPGYWCKIRRYPEERILLVLLANHDFVQEEDIMDQLSALVFSG
ncbi:serine hydrolase domain-containing protein [Paenibacillus terrigena]|uniref:serine hydrolase domain-containing protein n=1 Tax=Paenibacillus terrigena TaxID=369333 RepID=UPI0003703613|nr:serine hydrolase domain-containing protein [Paenibacillus terrigena]